MKPKETKDAVLAARAPEALVRKLDQAARRSRRSRSQEMIKRLEDSLALDRATKKAVV